MLALFFVLAAVLTAAAIAFIVRPLLGRRVSDSAVSHGATNVSIYRDQLRELETDLANGTIDRVQHDAARREIERRVLEESEEDSERREMQRGPQWRLAWVSAVAVPLIAIPMYLTVGSPLALDGSRVAAMAAASGGGDQHEITPERIAQMVDQLEQRLQQNPADLEGWVMLARSKMALERPAEAVVAYRKAIELAPADAQLLADFADTLAMAQGRSLKGEPEQLIERALKADPNNVKALALSGTVAFQNQNYTKAAAQWEKVVAQVDPQSPFAQRIQASIDEARNRGGLPAVASRAPAPQIAPAATTPSAASGARLTGSVSLGASAKSGVAPGDTVFVFARAAEGPRMPLAILRLQARDLPTEFELNESMAMAPGMSIGQFPDLVVGARVSKAGSATPAAGDWESVPLPVSPGASGLRIVIDQQRR
jgi:cytochrome c-type biogenesis protein CcmH